MSTSDQQQEIVRAVAWLRESSGAAVRTFVDQVNEADGPELRSLSDIELMAVRNFAMIGLHLCAEESVKRARRNQG